jgi:hypothetical protein
VTPDPLPEKTAQDLAALSGQPGWSILTDCLLTRRKRYHAVFTPDGDPVFKSRLFWDCVEYLDAIEVGEYYVANGALAGREEVNRLNVSKG